MSSFFDDASLVMIPSGYKTSKVYSVKPTDGTGDLTFTRSNSTATRVGPTGLIEKVRTNLVTYSEQFNDASWTKDSSTITANTTANPLDGAITADTWTSTADPSFLFKGVALGAGEHSLSIYAKAGASSSLRMDFITSGFTQGASLTFNLSAGTAGTITQYGTSTGFVASVQSLGNGWYRCSLTGSIAAGTYFSQFYIGSGSVILFGNQLETGVLTDYIATTTAAVSVGPVANVPRLDYTNSTCPKLLLEPQRTNVFTFSNTFSNAAWDKGGVTVTGGQVGVNTSNDAFLMTEDSANNVHRMQQTPVISGVSTISVYAKANTRNFLYLRGVQGAANARAWFNLSTGTVGTLEGGATAKMTASANGYYRCEMTLNHDLGFELYIGMSSTNGGLSYQGNGTGSIFVQNAQAEVGAYATSYIPTLGAAVTRGADAASKTGISSLIGQTEGTLFSDFYVVPNGQESMGAAVRNPSGGNYGELILMHTTSTRQPRAAVSTGGATQAEIIGGSALSVGYHKMAFAYKANDFVLYVDGVQIGTDTSGSVPVCSELYIDNYVDGGTRNSPKSQVLLFTTRLTNAQLAELTTI